MARALLLLLAALLVQAVPARAGPERILAYHSDIAVAADGALTVKETIRVAAAGQQIKRGIYRDFPTTYLSALGQRRVPFKVIEVTRDGDPEPWRAESVSNGIRIYIGRPDAQLPPGEYEYAITYRTGRQLGFFADHDELYWNVTGNGWEFPIESASATVGLPAPVAAAALRLDAYTGFQGEKGRDFAAAVNSEGDATFRTTAPLLTHQGLTIVVGFPKGIVPEPDLAARIGQWAEEFPEWRPGLGGLLVLLAYYALAWFWVGRDPEGGIIIPRFEPPREVSPADARFLTQMGFDDRAFAAALISLGVKGHLAIEEASGRDFTVKLRARPDAHPPANDEAALLAKLRAQPQGTLAFTPANHTQVREARKALRLELKKEHLKRHFVTNGPWLVPGLFVTIGTLMAGGPRDPENAAMTLFMLVWLTGWTFGVYALAVKVAWAWRQVAGGSWLKVVPALLVTAFSVPFFAGEVFGLGVLYAFSPVLAVLLLVMAGINYLFYHLLKAPTRLGRPLYDALAGFRMYLSVAEKDRLDLMNPPERTPELFEKYLPYALALGVENQWAEQFAEILARSRREGAASGPSWYRGPSWSASSPRAFAGAVAGGLSSAISSASSPPGSRSGGGGGGSSGGGGGGGGGGGW
jgi:uncharacterized membrane protein YgcG